VKNTENIQNVFLLSSGRSGSTLLSNILNAHSEILSVPESTFIITISKLFSKNKSFSESDYKRIIDCIWLRKEEYKYLWKIDSNDLLQILIKEKPQDLKSIFEFIYLSYRGAGANNSPSIIIDKNPFYFHFLKPINKTFPKAKYIILVRDYRDRMVSLRKSKYSNQIAANIIKGIAWNSRNMCFYNMKNRPDVHLIRYEDLVTSPEENISEICAFLNLTFEKEMLEFYTKNPHDYESLDTSIEMKNYVEDLHKRSNTKINTDRIGLWKSHLSKSNVSILETYCGKTGELYGYEKSVNNNSLTNLLNRLKLFPKITLASLLLSIKKKSFSLPYSIQLKVVSFLKRK